MLGQPNTPDIYLECRVKSLDFAEGMKPDQHNLDWLLTHLRTSGVGKKEECEHSLILNPLRGRARSHRV